MQRMCYRFLLFNRFAVRENIAKFSVCTGLSSSSDNNGRLSNNYYRSSDYYHLVIRQGFSTSHRQQHSPSNTDRNAVLRPSQPTPVTMDEKRDVQTLLNLIIEKSRERGTELVFAESFVKNLDHSPLSLLLNEGRSLNMDYIAEAFALRPKFLEIPLYKWEQVLKPFREAEMSLGIVLPALVGNPEVFEIDPDEINAALVRLSTRGVSDRVLAAVLAKKPEILTSDLKKVEEHIENMTSFFPRRKLMMLIRKDPHILFGDFEEIEAKYEYIYNEMGLEQKDVSQSKEWFRRPLSEIECRHLFLVRCGQYVKPDEKKPDVSVDNPSLVRILDTDDEEFCHHVAGVSVLEWDTFKKIYETEEPLQANLVDERYLKRSRRIAPKVVTEKEWEDVRLDEVERLAEEEDDEDEGEDDFEDDDRGGRTENRRHWNTQHDEQDSVTFKEKRFFRKRGVYLASED